MGGFLFLGFVVWAVCAWYAAVIAGQKGRRQWVWALLGIVFGPLAMFAVFLMAPVKGAHSSGSGSGAGSVGPAASKRHDPRADLYEVPHKKH
jgi:hypothetical protein